MEEQFDLCSKDRVPLGRKGLRGLELAENEYHIVVMAILINEDDNVLITKRSENKIAGGKWECTAGSVVAGEKSKDAVIREIREEIGILVQIDYEKPVSHFISEDAIWDIWVVRTANSIEELILQQEEVDEAKYVAISEIKMIIDSGFATQTLEELLKLHQKGMINIAS